MFLGELPLRRPEVNVIHCLLLFCEDAVCLGLRALELSMHLLQIVLIYFAFKG